GCVQLTGRWYSIGLASNSNWFKEKRHLMKMSPTHSSPPADGNLEVTSTYPKGDKCEKRNSLYTKTEQPGGLPLTLLLATGRTKELSPERLERFTQFSKEQGLADDEILILPQTDKCMVDAA
ncbi:PREDICTED: LOW QUALITY PROTEIN: lipocalin-like, partial [Mesitornis unicolor]|uniref:LOW QUALITY PROTEIN: lipocalin-like n=1 Tax=Mesitornis unicolor TaxID=54374 RepID=UPI000528DDCB